jgi:hypothetical protein
MSKVRLLVLPLSMVLTLAWLGGCAMGRRIAVDPITYNKSLAEASNRLLLLNIARASKNHPLYFTDVSEVNETLANGVEGGATVPWLNPANSADTQFTAGGSVSAEAAFTMTPTMTKAFFAGITQPIGFKLFRYYWDQGWPKRLLLALVVRQIDLTHKEKDGKEHTHSYTGAIRFFEPDPIDGYVKFRQLADWLADQKPKLEPSASDPKEAIGPGLKLDPANPDTLRALVETDKAGYSLKESGSAFALHSPAGEEWQLTTKVPAHFLDDTKSSSDRAAMLAQSTKEEDKADVKMTLYLRSPEAILYHLGELVRAERSLGYRAMLKRSTRELPLFSARGTSCCGISVTYCGERYCVGGDPMVDESMHVLSFLHQMILLHKESSEQPKSSFVRVLGGR